MQDTINEEEVLTFMGLNKELETEKKQLKTSFEEIKIS
jgi:hypothetical protein